MKTSNQRKPMSHYVLLSCGRRQQALAPECKVAPQELYTSGFFAAKLHYAKRHCPKATVFIISTKHHLIELKEPSIKNYDFEIRGNSIYNNNEANKDEPVESTAQWAERIAQELQNKGANLANDRFTILAGANMANPLQVHLAKVELPLRGMRIGEQLAFLRR